MLQLTSVDSEGTSSHRITMKSFTIVVGFLNRQYYSIETALHSCINNEKHLHFRREIHSLTVPPSTTFCAMRLLVEF